MPDRGMWNMKNKVCNSFGNFWYEGDTCPDCNVELSIDNSGYGAGKNGPTSGKGWGSPKRMKYCEKDWLKRRRKMPSRITKKEKARLLNTAPAEEVLPFIRSRKSEFGQSKPMTKRTITKVEGERVPEGWVYIERNPDVPSIVKIGKTFPDGIASIMSDARRFGRAELVAKYYFKEAYKAEQSIHKRLERHNLRVLGYKDCGKELFQCDEMVAIFAVLAEGPVLDDDEDAA